MSEPVQQTANRVLLVLDPCRESLAALDSALALAAHLRAELVALFIEDESLLHLAGLPFAREVDSVSAVERRLDASQMSLTFRAQAEQVRRTVTRSAAALQVQASVKVVRGQFVSAALSAAVATDVVFLARAGGVAQPQRPAGRKPVRHKPVWVLFDGSAAAERALIMAAQLSDGRELVVLLPGASADEVERLRQGAARVLGEQRVRWVGIPSAEIADLLAVIKRPGCSLLVLHRDSPLLTTRTAQNLLDNIDCPVVMAH